MAKVETRFPAAPSAYADTFARDHLPPLDLWPKMDYSDFPGPRYPERLNCAAELLDRWVERGHGDRTAMLWDGGSWTYRELAEQSNRIAGVLRSDLGVVPGNRVLLRGPNSPMMAACWLGVVKAGAVVVPTMPLLRTRELAYVAEKAMVRLALTDHRLADDLHGARGQAPVLERVVTWGGGGDDGLEAMMALRSPDFTPVDTAADDVAMIAFTSGTTGRAKGTMHFHRDMLACADTFSAHVLRPSPDDIFCGSPPLAFTFGLGGLLLFPLRAGAAVLLVEQPSGPNLLTAIQDHRATVLFTAPTAYRAMLDILPGYDLSSLHKCVSAGETLPLPTFEAWEQATGVKIIDGIGSTEMLHIFIGCPEDEIRPGTTGRAVPGYRARIIDENGEPLPPGSVGRLAVRGPTGCRYLADPERQAGYVLNGWNLTGDAYRMDEDGYFWYQARTDDMIVSSGYNIAGPEVEAVLLEHPAVLECGVVGLPDAGRGQVVSAFVVLRPGHEPGEEMTKSLQEFVKTHIAPYKYPRRVTFVDQLPRTQTGKLQRFRLREGV